MKRSHMLALVCVIVFCLTDAVAGQREVYYSNGELYPVTLYCIQAASKRYDVPLDAMLGILSVERGTPGVAYKNNNESWDMGPYQINTHWHKRLSDAGIGIEKILNNGCVNTGMAAWILRQELNQGKSIWEAIGAYHSPNAERQKKYIAEVQKSLNNLNIEHLLKKVNEL